MSSYSTEFHSPGRCNAKRYFTIFDCNILNRYGRPYHFGDLIRVKCCPSSLVQLWRCLVVSPLHLDEVFCIRQAWSRIDLHSGICEYTVLPVTTSTKRTPTGKAEFVYYVHICTLWGWSLDFKAAILKWSMRSFIMQSKKVCIFHVGTYVSQLFVSSVRHWIYFCSIDSSSVFTFKTWIFDQSFSIGLKKHPIQVLVSFELTIGACPLAHPRHEPRSFVWKAYYQWTALSNPLPGRFKLLRPVCFGIHHSGV